MPYGELEELGISRKAADNLPRAVKEVLARGGVTPLIQARIPDGDGGTAVMPVRLQAADDENGVRRLYVCPVYLSPDPQAEALGLSEEEKERLKRGETMEKPVGMHGPASLRLLQLDPETNAIMHGRKPVPGEEEKIVKEKLKDMEKVDDIELGTQQKEMIRRGKPVEIDVGGEKVTVGLDLREPQTFRVLKGDMKEWERQQKMRYDIGHPEFMGYVQTDRNRWEYRRVVDRQSRGRAVKPEPERTKPKGLHF